MLIHAYRFTQPPCYGCVPPERSSDCHSTCKKHKEWLVIHQKELEEYHQRERYERDAESVRNTPTYGTSWGDFMNNKLCPNFECLDFSKIKCEKYPACEGCPKHCSCLHCNNQASVAGKTVLLCDLIRLPQECRFCTERSKENFSPDEACISCPVRKKLNSIKHT